MAYPASLRQSEGGRHGQGGGPRSRYQGLRCGHHHRPTVAQRQSHPTETQWRPCATADVHQREEQEESCPLLCARLHPEGQLHDLRQRTHGIAAAVDERHRKGVEGITGNNPDLRVMRLGMRVSSIEDRLWFAMGLLMLRLGLGGGDGSCLA